MNNRAQGTIEYLVIIAVVVIISLVVVALFLNTATPLESAPSKLTGIESLNGLIHIDSFYLSPDGNYYIVFDGLSTEPITIENITVNGTQVDFSDLKVNTNHAYFSDSKLSFAESTTKLIAGSKVAYRIPNITVAGCTQGKQEIANLVITYSTNNGAIRKTIKVDNFPVTCQTGTVSSRITLVQPAGTVSSEVTVPTLSFGSSAPANGANYIGLTPTTFSYSLSSHTNVSSCSLIIDGTIVKTVSSITSNSGSITPNSPLTKGARTWDINCTLSDNNVITASATPRTVYLYDTASLSHCKHLSWSTYTKYTFAGSNLTTGIASGSGSGVTEDLSNDLFTNCFTFDSSDSHVILDCSNKVFTGNLSWSGVNISGSTDINIMNCEFDHFGSGVTIDNSAQNISLSGITLTSNWNTGLYLGTGNTVALSDITSCTTASNVSYFCGQGNTVTGTAPILGSYDYCSVKTGSC